MRLAERMSEEISIGHVHELIDTDGSHVRSYMWRRGPGSQFSLQLEHIDWPARTINVIDFVAGPGSIPQGESYRVLMQAVDLLDSWSREKRGYALLRGTGGSSTRIVCFLSSQPSGKTYIVSVCVIQSSAGRRKLVVFLDDYMSPHVPNSHVCYGSKANQMLVSSGFQVGGRFQCLFFI
jgi:hypothetical protein